MRRLLLMMTVAAAALSPLAAEVTLTPVAGVTALGGQYGVTGSAPSPLAGRLDAFFSPALNFSPQTALIPLYSGSYSSVKDVHELVDAGGTLTSEVQSHVFSLKLVHKYSDTLKLKLRLNHRREYRKETKDESWGGGLFDYNRTGLGVEAERSSGGWGFRAGADYYATAYPNYQSIVSKSETQTAVDTTTYSEIAAQQGQNVLDYRTLALFAECSRAFSGNVSGYLRYDLALKDFADQKVARNQQGADGGLRSDRVHSLTGGIALAGARVSLDVADTLQYYDSNQNSWDTAKPKFTANAYRFIENTVSPAVTVRLGRRDRPVSAVLAWDLGYRSYTDRLAQDAESNYRGETVYQVTNGTSLTVSWPLVERISARVLVNYSNTSSNMKYEQYYTYNYSTFNYLFGINWEL